MTANALLREGRNCWRIVHSDRTAVLVDADAYYSHLHDALLEARQSILILGWDFDGRIMLKPGDENSPGLGDFLRRLVETHAGLHVDILVWSVAVWHAPSSSTGLLLGESWQDHPRIRLRLDTHHPLYAAHHQKVVCIDGALAFAGGIDLTVMRWDSSAHHPDDPLRRDPDGNPYGAVHDVQMAVSGEAASALVDVVHERWHRAKLPLPRRARRDDALWPPRLQADFLATRVGIARTFPLWEDGAQIEEIVRLTQDAVRAARTYIYIEAQYLTAPEIATTLADKLADGDGPDVVIVVTKRSKGRAEQFVMGRNRRRLLRRLVRADHHHRLRIYYPAIVENGREMPIHVHAKLMIVDDRFLRVGSANLNNRSMGLDTECDLIVEAEDDAARTAICRIRERLMAEHLGASETEVRDAAQAARSLLAGIDRLNYRQRQLKPISIGRTGPTRPVWGTFVLDPRRPIALLALLQQFLGGAARRRWRPRLQRNFRRTQKS